MGPDAGDVVNPLGGPDLVKTGTGNDSLSLVDGTADRADCGGGVDTVQADPADELSECEQVTLVSPAATGGGAAPAAPAAPAALTDAEKPSCTLKGLAKSYDLKAFLKGPQPAVGCDEQVSLEAELTTRAPSPKKKGAGKSAASTSAAGDLVLAEKSTGLAQSQKVRLKPLGRLASQLGAKFKATIRIVARDKAGNSIVLKRTVSVKPDAAKQKKRG